MSFSLSEEIALSKKACEGQVLSSSGRLLCRDLSSRNCPVAVFNLMETTSRSSACKCFKLQRKLNKNRSTPRDGRTHCAVAGRLHARDAALGPRLRQVLHHTLRDVDPARWAHSLERCCESLQETIRGQWSPCSTNPAPAKFVGASYTMCTEVRASGSPTQVCEPLTDLHRLSRQTALHCIFGGFPWHQHKHELV